MIKTRLNRHVAHFLIFFICYMILHPIVVYLLGFEGWKDFFFMLVLVVLINVSSRDAGDGSYDITVGWGKYTFKVLKCIPKNYIEFK